MELEITKKNLKNASIKDNVLTITNVEGYADEVIRIECFKQLPFTIDDIVPEKRYSGCM